MAPRTPSARVVTKTRPRTYPERKQANRPRRMFVKGRWRMVRKDDPGGTGHETVAESLTCPDCARGT